MIRPGGSGETGEALALPLLSEPHDLALFPIEFSTHFSLQPFPLLPLFRRPCIKLETLQARRKGRIILYTFILILRQSDEGLISSKINLLLIYCTFQFLEVCIIFELPNFILLTKYLTICISFTRLPFPHIPSKARCLKITAIF